MLRPRRLEQGAGWATRVSTGCRRGRRNPPGRAHDPRANSEGNSNPHTFSAGRFTCLSWSPCAQVRREASTSQKEFVTQVPSLVLSLWGLLVLNYETFGAHVFSGVAGFRVGREPKLISAGRPRASAARTWILAPDVAAQSERAWSRQEIPELRAWRPSLVSLRIPCFTV